MHTVNSHAHAASSNAPPRTWFVEAAASGCSRNRARKQDTMHRASLSANAAAWCFSLWWRQLKCRRRNTFAAQCNGVSPLCSRVAESTTLAQRLWLRGPPQTHHTVTHVVLRCSLTGVAQQDPANKALLLRAVHGHGNVQRRVAILSAGRKQHGVAQAPYTGAVHAGQWGCTSSIHSMPPTWRRIHCSACFTAPDAATCSWCWSP